MIYTDFDRYVMTVQGPEHLKECLEKDNIHYIVAVGDVTTATYKEWFRGLPNMVIIDGFGEAIYPTKIFSDIKDRIDLTVVIPKGIMSCELLDFMFNKITRHEDSIIRVVGEEDCAFLPALLFADESVAVIAGDPKNKRMVYMRGGLEARTYSWTQIITKNNEEYFKKETTQ